MFRSLENKILLGLWAGLFVLLLFFGIGHEEFTFFIILSLVALTMLFAVAAFFLYQQNQKTEKLRKATERIKETKDFAVEELPEMYAEGEIGKLAENIDAILREFAESGDKDKKQKDYLQDMLSDISHQLKTPIASLTVFTDILLQNAEKEAEIEAEKETEKETEIEAGKEAEIEAKNLAQKKVGAGVLTAKKRAQLLSEEEIQLERMKWLTYSILQLARVDAGAVTYDKKEVELYRLAKTAAEQFRVTAEKKQITIRIAGDEKATAKIDFDWALEAVNNIVKNAIDYSPENSEVCLTISKTPVATRLIVEDHGPGIKEEDRLKIFKRFYRVSGSEVNPSSVGIGLALSKSIVENMGGRLYVESLYKDDCVKEETSYTKMILIFSDEKNERDKIK